MRSPPTRRRPTASPSASTTAGASPLTLASERPDLVRDQPIGPAFGAHDRGGQRLDRRLHEAAERPYGSAIIAGDAYFCAKKSPLFQVGRLDMSVSSRVIS